MIAINASAVTVGTTLTKLCGVELAAEDRDISIEVLNRSTSAGTFNSFKIIRKMLAGDSCEYISDTDFATAGGRLFYSSKATAANATAGTKALNQINLLTPGQSGVVDFDAGSTDSVEFWASVASGTATVDVFGAARPLR